MSKRQTGRATRHAVASGLAGAIILAFAAVAGVGLSQITSASSQYQYGQYGGQVKVTICHHTHSTTNPMVTITVGAPAVPAHLRHHDTLGPCPTSAPTQTSSTTTKTKPNSTHAKSAHTKSTHTKSAHTNSTHTKSAHTNSTHAKSTHTSKPTTTTKPTNQQPTSTSTNGKGHSSSNPGHGGANPGKGGTNPGHGGANPGQGHGHGK